MPTQDDLLYSDAYNSLQNAMKSRNQNAVNEARNKIGALKGTAGEFGIGEFSKQLDGIQQNLSGAPDPYDPANDINRLKDAQKAAAIARLNGARTNSLSDLDAERSKVKPYYYNKRNETATGSKMQARNFAEFLAGRGQTSSGTSAQAEISRGTTLANNINSLNVSENEALADIARRQSLVNRSYENDLTAAEQGIEANAAGQLINANMQNYINSLNQYNADRGFNYNASQDAIRNALNEKQINWSMDTTNNPALAGQILNNNAQSINNQYLPQQLQGQVTAQQLQNAYQTLVNQGYPEQQAAQLASIYANIRQGDAQVSISQQNANTNSAQLAWAQDPSNPDNIAKLNSANSKNNNMVSQVTNAIYNKIYGQSSSEAALDMLQANKGGILSDLTASGMPADDALKLYKQMEEDLINRLNE